MSTMMTTKNEINNVDHEIKKPYLALKRLADIIFSSIIILLTTPIMAILVVLIKMESKGPAFYIQKRVGKNGKIFNVYKLRTMYTDITEEGLGCTTSSNDPRITKIGKLIRGCSLDEFPQFLNILKGEMSYIGPRPISVEEHQFVLGHVKKDGESLPQGLIHRVTPGLTGWALLHGREKISYEDRFRLNTEYEHNISLMFDAKIFYLTFKKYFFTNFAVFLLFVAAVSAYYLIF